MKRTITQSVLAIGGAVLALCAAGCASAAADSTQTHRLPRAIHVALGAPEDIAFDRRGNMYVSEFTGQLIDEVNRAGRLKVIAGTGIANFSGNGGQAVHADLNDPSGLISEAGGSLIVADHRNGCIRRISAAGVITSIVGRCGHEGFSGDGGPAAQAELDDPIGIAQDHSGNLYIADEQNHRLRRVGRDGVITTVAGGGKLHVEQAPNGTLGTKVWLRHPSYLAIDSAGNVYMSDFWANVVIRLSPDGRITHIAGSGIKGFSGDGGPATRARLDFPTGLALTKSGDLYISDSWNNRIRLVTRQGIIVTVAGAGPTGFSGDGGRATKAHLNAPSGIALGARGTLFITDQGNNVVRAITRGGVITTVAGVTP